MISSKRVGAHIDQRAAHTLAFHLEHADHVAPRQHRITRRIVERQRRQVEFYAALLQQFYGKIEHRQRFQAKEVEFHQARRLHPFHVELGHRHVGFRVAVERHQFAQGPVADHDAGGMGRGMPGQAFKALGDIEGARNDRVFVRNACSLGSLAIAAARVTGAAGFCGTSFVSLST